MVLGPSFFQIYVDDMVKACKGLNLVLFVDNTNIFARGRDPAELFGRVNKGMVVLSKWLRCNKPTLNLEKTGVYFSGQGRWVGPPMGGEEKRSVEGGPLSCYVGR